MKKTVVKFIALSLGLITALFYAFGCADVAASAKESEVISYLVLGLDDAAQNADVIMLVGCNTSDGTLTFLQIPRDTYFDYGGGQNKINGAFAAYRNGGLDEHSSLVKFSSDVSEAFGVDIAASFAVTIPAFLRFVDKLGGIRIQMPYDFTFTDEHGESAVMLPRGENLLDAKMAERFVRYRRGYSLGDLSRMDAQKIFFSGVVKTVTSAGVTSLVRAAYSARDSIYADCKYSDFLKILVKKPGRNKKLSCRFLTLPGEAVMRGGVSYYCANRKNSNEVLRRYFCSDSFDEALRLLLASEDSFYNVYYDDNADYREYTDDTLGDIRLK